MSGDAVTFIRSLGGAWDCCATCAGGVLAAHDAAIRAEAWDEGEQAGRDNSDDGYPDPMIENPYRAAQPTEGES